MKVRKGAVLYSTADPMVPRVPIAVGDQVPCPKCTGRHVVQVDPRPGQSLNTETGEMTPVKNEALYVVCPQAPGPIVVGMAGFALPEPLELTPRKTS